MWEVVLWMMAALAVVICPFLMFFYEAYDPEKPKWKANRPRNRFHVDYFRIFALVTGLCYWKVGVSQIKFEAFATGPQLLPVTNAGILNNGTYEDATLVINVTFTTYCMGMLCFFGWIFFFFYGGVGVTSYPIRKLLAFPKRVKRIGSSRFTQEMANILAKAEALLELSLQLQKQCRSRISRQNKSKVNIIRNEVYILEAQQNQLIWAYTKAGGSPFIVYGGLAMHIICLGTGIAWILHIFIYNTFDADPFLNTLLIELNNAFALCAVVGYGVLAFYLMWSTFQGQIALGLRLIFFQIHPMKKGDTLVNSFLFNAALLNITAFAVLQFVTRSFQGYAPLTALNGLMNVYVMNLKGIGKFIEWIQYGIVVMAILAVIWVLVCKKEEED
ncbi:LMBR1 domain-containing protein 1 [Angomonas deanei]|nr:LMBR1 domain-containing protein 1 [Angomonas deanei]|eukprot:EPY34374.1 LMBR1 domain-containing protein 1 [Angomonas deanei]